MNFRTKYNQSSTLERVKYYEDKVALSGLSMPINEIVHNMALGVPIKGIYDILPNADGIVSPQYTNMSIEQRIAYCDELERRLQAQTPEPVDPARVDPARVDPARVDP